MTNPSTLDEIEARASAATEGPWEVGGMDSGHSAFEMSIWVTTGNGDSICDMDGQVRALNVAPPNDDGLADAEFIAHAREDVPTLVAALRAVEAVHRRYGLYELEDSCEDTSDKHREEHHHECSDDIGEFYCDQLPVGDMCDECRDEDGERMDWPCPTIAAIREALGA